ncbi:MAG: acetyl-CoA hydrolase/transferase C-terminal domain-containing protein [Pseudomonadota bacterium]
MAVSAYRTPEDAAEHILSRLGKRVTLGLPLGIGKANHIANALYARAEADSSIALTIFSAVSLGVPEPLAGADLKARFIAPLIGRINQGHEPLLYAKAQAAGALPRNISVHEFFLPAGAHLGNPDVQQAYLSANYTHVVSVLLDAGVNVLAPLVSPSGEAHSSTSYSLSSNTDLVLDFLSRLDERTGAGPFLLTGQANRQLPYMRGPGEVETARFDGVLDTPETQFDLFSVPRQPVTLMDYATALHCAAMIPDGGTLQIGIGSFSDALTQALLVRHREAATFEKIVDGLVIQPSDLQAHRGRFETGLYASSEMLVEGLVTLMKAGVIARPANAAVDDPDLAALGAPEDAQALIHAGFFLGAGSFYRRLREMPEVERDRIRMMPISFVNDLFGSEALKRAQRRDARFINNGLMATLLGAVVSDGLEDGRVISGVGGQYNFVAQAHELKGARSILTVRATRGYGSRMTSNVVWNYGHVTIPRHLRDVVVTEYGAADLRGKSDRDCIAAMLNVADSRFQDDLLTQAKKARKIEASYRIPDSFRGNSPEQIADTLGPAQARGDLPMFPLGTEMTATEQRLVPALQHLAANEQDRLSLLRGAYDAWRGEAASAEERDALARLDLASPEPWRDRLMHYAVLWALRETASDAAAITAPDAD